MIKVRKNSELYLRLKELDAKVFPGCDNEFQPNRDWWVQLDYAQNIYQDINQKLYPKLLEI